ncbi:hypothetical protein Cme02nite_35130 [Catellatospora methionotrophica]|uniref:Uncharacterized protein n=1 Tax=Catellatospora methionotrophica TaxID=121620 RepID=A0A8J3PF09_9ACTN|nr:hypothetical protein [Catellatospora methionotrophica]GIG15181.1 hypothetical protein Cme02nite_35130 [Catellatospora methionotrophica]
MDRLRTPFFFVALVALGLVVAVETGSSWLLGLTTPALDTATQLGADVPPGVAERPGGIAISYLALIDVVLLGTAALMGVAILASKRVHARLQGLATLIGAIILIITALVLLFVAIAKLILMVSLLLAFPFGTIVYLILFGSFPRGEAATVLSLIMFLKVVAVVCLVAAQQRFLQNKGLVAMVITSLLGNVVAVFLHGMVPGVLVSITDAIAGIVFAIVGIVWAIVLIVGAIPALIRAVQVTVESTKQLKAAAAT